MPGPGGAEMLFEPTGDLEKDYSAYCEIGDKDERPDVLDGISVTELEEGGRMRTSVVMRNLNYCFHKRDAAPLASAMPHCHTLHSVHLTSCGVTEHAYKLLIEALYKSPSVVSFAIDFNPGALYKDPTVSRKDRNEVVVLPSQFRGAHLRPPEPEVKEDGGKKGAKVDAKKAAAAAAAAKQAAAEEQAAADRVPIQLPTGWHAALLTGIQQLSLRGNDITDAQVELMAPLLEKNLDLLSLSLWGNSITDAGATRLAAALTKHRRLTALNLGHNGIGDMGLRALAGMFFTTDVSNEAALVARQRCYPKDTELPCYPTYQDLHALAAAAAASTVLDGDSAKKDASKKKDAGKGKGKAEGPTERHRAEFDRDCVRLGENLVRIPGVTSLWCLNLSHNAAVTPAGVDAFVAMLNSREPDVSDTLLGAQAPESVHVPPAYAAGISLEKIEVAHPKLDPAAQKALADALAASIAARAAEHASNVCAPPSP